MTKNWEDRRSGWIKHPEDARSNHDIDYSRIVHSGSFRRLQGKTQTLNLGDSDFYRTRLTHTMEVAQIATSLVRQLELLKGPVHAILPSSSLIQAVGLAHDLGHPPFGHGGEVALNYCMRDHGGFEGNGQTLRILSRLENFSKVNGADLTRRALLGVLKYPVALTDVENPQIKPILVEKLTTIRSIDRTMSKPPKCYMASERDVVDWVLEPVSNTDQDEFRFFDAVTGEHASPRHKSFDCSIMDLADDIAYGVHDLEDAIALGLVDPRSFATHITEDVCSHFLDILKKKYPDESQNNVYEALINGLFAGGGTRKRFIGRLVHHFVTNVIVEEVGVFNEPLLRYRVSLPKEHKAFLRALKDVIKFEVIRSAEVQHLEFKGQKMVVSVFEAFLSDPGALLAKDAYKLFEASHGDVRVICDHVAGMTDSYLLKTYDRLFSPRMGSIFDKL